MTQRMISSSIIGRALTPCLSSCLLLPAPGPYPTPPSPCNLLPCLTLHSMAAAQEPGNVAVASVLDADYYGKEDYDKYGKGEYEPKYEHKGEYEPKYEPKYPHSEYEKKDYGYGKASMAEACAAALFAINA